MNPPRPLPPPGVSRRELLRHGARLLALGSLGCLAAWLLARSAANAADCPVATPCGRCPRRPGCDRAEATPATPSRPELAHETP